ncbi:unnamed protein product, partial [Ectocarpus fasciculatus]
ATRRTLLLFAHRSPQPTRREAREAANVAHLRKREKGEPC